MSKDLSETLTVEQGVIKGSMHQKVEIAKNLISYGMTTEEVSANTGLNEFAVNQLR